MIYDYNKGKNVLTQLLPKKGDSAITSIINGIGYVKYNDLTAERLEYDINSYANFEYPNGSFMFWFKIDQAQNGKCLISFGNTVNNQIYVLFENNSLALYAIDSSGSNYKLISDVGNIKLNEWNYVGVAFHNRNDGIAYDDICRYTLQLNGTQKVYKKENPRLYVDIPINYPVGIGCRISGNKQLLKFNGDITALMFGEGKYEGDVLDKYYRLCKEYVFRKIFTDSECKTLYSSSVDKYDINDNGINLLENYKIYPLHIHKKL